MARSNPRIRSRSGLAVLMAGVLACAPGIAGAAEEPQIPHCTAKIGTVAVREPQAAQPWWQAMQLESPAALIKVYVSESGCFTLVDRGAGFDVAQAERNLAYSGETRAGSNLGKGQVKAADYVLVPDISSQNANASGHDLGGIVGGLLGAKFGSIGAMAGDISIKKKTADVVLTLTDVRSTEQVAMHKGHADKTNIGWGAGGLGGFGGGLALAGARGYANTEIGQVVAMAYLDAYAALVAELQRNPPTVPGDNVQAAVHLNGAAELHAASDPQSAVVRQLDSGAMLYPTGEKFGVWWQVTDELGNAGWVLSNKLEAAR